MSEKMKLSELMRESVREPTDVWKYPHEAKTVCNETVRKWADEAEMLETQLQDANRKLAALGHCPTDELVPIDGTSIRKRGILNKDIKVKCFVERSLCQQDWDDYEDWLSTRKDAYNSGNP